MSFLEKNYPIESPDTVLLLEELSVWSSQFGKLLLDNMPIGQGMSVLDVGCGAGFPLFELANRLGPNAKLTGIDPWETGVKRALWKKEKLGLENVEILLGNAAEIPFADQSFDLVVSNLGINNFDNPAQVMQECWRVLKRNGRICITTNLNGHFMEFYSIFEAVLRELGLEKLLPKLKEQEQHRGTDESVRDLLENARLSVLKVLRDKFVWRYADGTAFFNHFLTLIGFLPSWKGIVPEDLQQTVFEHLEKKLNQQAEWDGELRMTVPVLYMEAVK